MSQIIKPLTSSGPIPPAIPTQFTADDSTIAIPAANNLNVFSRDTTDNNLNGIQTTADPNLSDNLFVELTNRITGTATTTDGVTPVNVYTFNLGATPGTYLFFAKFVVFNVTDNLSAGYSSFATVRTTGAAGTLLTAGNFFTDEEGSMSSLDIANTVSGNNLTLDVIGIAGKTIHYVALTEFTFVS